MLVYRVFGGFAMILSGFALPGGLITLNSMLSFIQAVPACLFAAYIGERLLPKQVRAPRYETVIILIYAAFYSVITAFWLPARLGISVPWM
jgi:hypothetical protein